MNALPGRRTRQATKRKIKAKELETKGWTRGLTSGDAGKKAARKEGGI